MTLGPLTWLPLKIHKNKWEDEVRVNLKTKVRIGFGMLQAELKATTTRSQNLDPEKFEEANRLQQQQIKVEL